jgi:two-component system chemotaxis response regulator CheB
MRRDIFLLAASIGGVEALTKLVSALPPDLPASLFIVLHIGGGESQLPLILNRAGRLRATHAKDAERIERCHVYVAPPDHHMRLETGVIHLDRGPKENFTRPAADPLFRSAAAAYGGRVVGIVLTGGDSDGSEGLKAVKAAGGITVVQDPQEALEPSMPMSALVYDSPDYCRKLAGIPNLIVELSSSAAD